MVTREQVERLARMVRVELSDDEAEAMRTELAHMLEFAARLQELDVGDTPEWTPPPPAGRPLRADVPRDSLPRDVALALAPSAVDGFFQVPRTLDEG